MRSSNPAPVHTITHSKTPYWCLFHKIAGSFAAFAYGLFLHDAVASMAMRTFLTNFSEEELLFSESEMQEMELLVAHEELASSAHVTGDE